MMNVPFLSVALAAPLLLSPVPTAAPVAPPSAAPLLGAPIAWAPSPQDADVDERRQRQENPELTVRYFQPSRAPVDDLVNALQRLVLSNPTGDFRYFTLQTLGGTLLVQGPTAIMPEVLKLAQELDQNYVAGGRVPGIDQSHHQYRVRNVSLAHLEQALQFLDRNRMQQFAGPPRGLQFSYVYGSGMVQMSGMEEYVERAKQVIAEVDVPQPSLMLSCFLLKGTSEAKSSPNLPASLQRDLSALVPYEGFEIMSSGMLPTNASSDMQLRVDLEDQQGSFELVMRPAAYDAERGLLALEQIDFQLNLQHREVTAESAGAQMMSTVNTRRSFSTSTTLATDRYSVLGAVGGDPVFVVVRLTETTR